MGTLVQTSNATANSLSTGNSTVNVVANSTVFAVSNSTSTANIIPTSIAVGNSTANLVITSTQIFIGNSTQNAIINTTSLAVGNNFTANGGGIYQSNTSATINAFSGNVGSMFANGTMVKLGSAVDATATALNPTSNTILLGNTIGRWVITANSLTVNTITQSTNTLTLGTSTSQANLGYTRLPNGILMQWGCLPANTTTAAFNLPVALTTVYNAQFFVNAAAFTAQGSSVNTTQVTARSTQAVAATAQVFWLVIGI